MFSTIRDFQENRFFFEEFFANFADFFYLKHDFFLFSGVVFTGHQQQLMNIL